MNVGTRHTVLLTGSAGAIGRAVAEALTQRGHYVRGFDLKPSSGVAESVVGSIHDMAAVSAAAAGVDTIVHLAAYPDDADFSNTLLKPNVEGVHRVMESAVAQRVRRVVLASSVQVISGLVESGRTVGVNEHAPINHYALFKLWAEECGRMYARRHGLEVLAVRIGAFPRDTEQMVRIGNTQRARRWYLSHEDGKRFFTLAVESPMPEKFAVVYALSVPPEGQPPLGDPEPARRMIGFEPQDAFPDGAPASFLEAVRSASASPPPAPRRA